jgi:hypothetical protein
MKRPRIYADTSVFGGCFDDEFAEYSNIFFKEIKQGKFKLIISRTILRELDLAPKYVQEILAELPAEAVEFHDVTKEIAS